MVRKLKYVLVFVVALITLLYGNRADDQNPGEHWQQYKFVEHAGFSPGRISKDYSFSK